MNDPEIVKLMNRLKLKYMRKVSALYSKPIPFLLERVAEIRHSINYMSLEMSMMQRFIEDNQLDILIDGSRSDTDSETSQSTSLETPIISTALTLMGTTGKRPNKIELTLEHKLSLAQHYMIWLSRQVSMKRRLTNAYINDQVALIEHQDLTVRGIQKEVDFLLSRVGPAVCFAKIKPGEVPGQGRRMMTERFLKLVFINDTKRDQCIRAAKLENIIALKDIKKAGEVGKYEEQVDCTEFYRKLLEVRMFPKEIDHMTNTRMRLASRASMEERQVYNMRRHLEKRVARGDELRERIARERSMIDRVAHNLATVEGTLEKENYVKEKRQRLLSGYTTPEVSEYVQINRRNEELKVIVKLWEKKVAVAKLIKDNNQQQLRRLSKQGPLTV